jgi:hypothetical protein
MPDQNDRNADDREQRASRGRDEAQSPELEEALRPRRQPELEGDMDENRNLTGSTTWETLTEEKEQRGRGSNRDDDEGGQR